jgi:hypothetical protein
MITKDSRSYVTAAETADGILRDHDGTARTGRRAIVAV